MKKIIKKEFITLLIDTTLIIFFLLYDLANSLWDIIADEYVIYRMQFSLPIMYPLLTLCSILIIRKFFKITNNIEDVFKQKYIIILKVFIEHLSLFSISCLIFKGAILLFLKIYLSNFCIILFYLLFAFIINFFKSKKKLKIEVLSFLFNILFFYIICSTINIMIANEQIYLNLKTFIVFILIFTIQKLLYTFVLNYYNEKLQYIKINNLIEILINSTIFFFICKLIPNILLFYRMENPYSITFSISLIVTTLVAFISKNNWHIKQQNS